MTVPRMHADEVETDAGLVRRLLEGQFPQWADRPIERVASAGTDNAIYRLGDDLAARLPRIHWATGQVPKEARWLPHLAPRLPVAISVPLAVGEPAEGYPWQWAVHPWLRGANPAPEHVGRSVELARDLARFIRALWSINTTGGPPAGPGNFRRGEPLADLDAGVRTTIEQLPPEMDRGAITEAWEIALAAPAWAGPPVWLHGDLMAGNLLVVDGRLSAVIDFGCLGVGDPAADLTPAWNLLEGEAREAFRDALDIDEATWARGRGWALRSAGAIPYYQHTNPTLANVARRAIAAVLAERGRG